MLKQSVLIKTGIRVLTTYLKTLIDSDLCT